MYIQKDVVVTIGGLAITTPVQRIDNIVIQNNVINVGVQSFANDTITTPSAGTTYQMPWQFATEADLRVAASNWLVSSSGPLAGGSIIQEEDELQNAKDVLSAAVNTVRDTYIAGGADTSIGKVDTDDASLRNILGASQMAALAAAASQSFSINWRMFDNSTQTLTGTQMIEMASQVMTYVTMCYNVSWAVKAAIDALTDISAAQTYDASGAFISELNAAVAAASGSSTSRSDSSGSDTSGTDTSNSTTSGS